KEGLTRGQEELWRMVAILIRLIASVDPHGAKPDAGGARHVPALGRLERDGVGTDAERRGHQLVDARMRLELADHIGGKDVVYDRVERGGAQRRLEHGR